MHTVIPFRSFLAEKKQKPKNTWLRINQDWNYKVKRQIYGGDRFVMHRNLESLCCTTGTKCCRSSILQKQINKPIEKYQI